MLPIVSITFNKQGICELGFSPAPHLWIFNGHRPEQSLKGFKEVLRNKLDWFKEMRYTDSLKETMRGIVEEALKAWVTNGTIVIPNEAWPDCTACDLPYGKHADDKCLYEPTSYSPKKLGEFNMFEGPSIGFVNRSSIIR